MNDYAQMQNSLSQIPSYVGDQLSKVGSLPSSFLSGSFSPSSLSPQASINGSYASPRATNGSYFPPNTGSYASPRATNGSYLSPRSLRSLESEPVQTSACSFRQPKNLEFVDKTTFRSPYGKETEKLVLKEKFGSDDSFKCGSPIKSFGSPHSVKSFKCGAPKEVVGCPFQQGGTWDSNHVVDSPLSLDRDITQICVSKPYLNFSQGFLLRDNRGLENVEVITSPSSIRIDIATLASYFPNLKAAYNIYIDVDETSAPLVRQLDLTYALFILDGASPELTLTSLLPSLNPHGYFTFFYGKGMISIWENVLAVKGTELPESLLKLVRVPEHTGCANGEWHRGPWKVYAVELNGSQLHHVEDLARSGQILLEKVHIKNQSKMFYGDYLLRQFIEGVVLELRGTQIPVFVLSGIGSIPALESLIYVYARDKGLLVDNSHIKIDYLMKSWFGDELPHEATSVSMEQIRDLISRHRLKPDHFKSLMLHDPLLVKLIKTESDRITHGKTFGDAYTPELVY